MREPGGASRSTEPGQASWTFREIQIPQASARDDDGDYTKDLTRQNIAECEQSGRNRRNGNGDTTHLQGTAGATLEVGTDRLSHGCNATAGARCAGRGGCEKSIYRDQLAKRWLPIPSGF